MVRLFWNGIIASNLDELDLAGWQQVPRCGTSAGWFRTPSSLEARCHRRPVFGAREKRPGCARQK
jgi:hypothetical protein